ncbi:tail fiber protein [Chitinophaga oryzae]|uniref:Tail fiber protein n=1 Tax=Chitinophaga oryzae TaxID=2725414 RepID=A0ABX6LRA3_9BACT|nr:tail fiber protein [Chitinophaga oryzae]
MYQNYGRGIPWRNIPYRIPIPSPGFAYCNGQLLQISEHSTLYSLIGTTYGGDGIETFALPNLQGRVPVGSYSQDFNYIPGAIGGDATTQLTVGQISNHTHSIVTDIRMKTGTAADTPAPGNAYPAPATAVPRYDTQSDEKMIALNVSDMVTPQGGKLTTEPNTTSNLPVDNMMPFLCLNYVISLQGIYPSPI